MVQFLLFFQINVGTLLANVVSLFQINVGTLLANVVTSFNIIIVLR